ncbi:MAG: helix-turn-helix domain-containing protein [Planctomycetota bacterium]
MLDLDISHIGLYTKTQYLQSDVGNSWSSLGFVVSGLKKRILSGVDTFTDKPHFILSPAGTPYEIQLGPGRENWVIILDDIKFLKTDIEGFTDLKSDKGLIRLPEIIEVPEESVPGWRLEMQKMQQCMQSPTRQNLDRAKLGVFSIFKYMLDSVDAEAASCPAERLKRFIDADTGFNSSIIQLSKRCGYSSDHLRILFAEKYHMSPNEYRNSRRVALAMDLINNTALSVKEISAKLGFEYVPAFSTMFKRLTGTTPREAVKRFRIVEVKRIENRELRIENVEGHTYVCL